MDDKHHGIPHGMEIALLRQLLETRFENKNSTYTNALTKMSEKTLVFYRKSIKDLSKTLAETVPELCKEHTEAIKKMQLEKTGQQNPKRKETTPKEAGVHCQRTNPHLSHSGRLPSRKYIRGPSKSNMNIGR